MHRLTGAGDKNLKAPSKNFYVPIYVPKLKARFYLIVFKLLFKMTFWINFSRFIFN